MPPRVARLAVAVSGPKHRPCSRAAASRSAWTTPGCTRASRASASIDTIWSSLETSSTTPAPMACPARLVPAPRMVSGTPSVRQASSVAAMSSSAAAITTACGTIRYTEASVAYACKVAASVRVSPLMRPARRSIATRGGYRIAHAPLRQWRLVERPEGPVPARRARPRLRPARGADAAAAARRLRRGEPARGHPDPRRRRLRRHRVERDPALPGAARGPRGSLSDRAARPRARERAARPVRAHDPPRVLQARGGGDGLQVRHRLRRRCRTTRSGRPRSPCDIAPQIALLEQILSDGPYALGEFTIADCAIAPVLFRTTKTGLDLSAYPKISRLRDAHLARPAFTAAGPIT